MLSRLRKFSHIYIEEDAHDSEVTEKLLHRFSKAQVVPISHYKEILNRSSQQFGVQKGGQKLILAKRREEFLYKGSAVAPDFGHQHFYYNALALNCLYDCEYCYLQGMFPSAHLVIFVNNGDYMEETRKKVQELGSMYLCLSYDTDLLALEPLIGYCREWIELSRRLPELTLEIRTKSVAHRSLKEITPHPGAILSWTLSPSRIAEKYEHGTPSTEARIKAIREVIELGWSVRVCIDPILATDSGWERDYSELLQELFAEISSDALTELSLGTFRIGEQYFKKLKKVQPSSLLIHQDLDKRSGHLTLSKEREDLVVETISKEAEKWLPKEKIEWVQPFSA